MTVDCGKQLDERQKSQHLYSIFVGVEDLFDVRDLGPEAFLVPVDFIYLDSPPPDHDHLLAEGLPQSLESNVFLVLVLGVNDHQRFDLIQKVSVLLDDV